MQLRNLSLHRDGASENWVLHRFTRAVPAVIAWVLVSTVSPPAKSDPFDITSPTAIILHPAYAGLPGNIYHTALYPDESPEQKIFALKLIPEKNFKWVMDDYKRIIEHNQWFENFCNQWTTISRKHEIVPEKQVLLFQWMQTHWFIRLENLWIKEYLWSFEPKVITALSEVWRAVNSGDCVETAQNIQKLLDDTRWARSKEEERFMNILKISGASFLGVLWLMFLFFWMTERRNYK